MPQASPFGDSPSEKATSTETGGTELKEFQSKPVLINPFVETPIRGTTSVESGATELTQVYPQQKDASKRAQDTFSKFNRDPSGYLGMKPSPSPQEPTEENPMVSQVNPTRSSSQGSGVPTEPKPPTNSPSVRNYHRDTSRFRSVMSTEPVQTTPPPVTTAPSMCESLLAGTPVDNVKIESILYRYRGQRELADQQSLSQRLMDRLQSITSRPDLETLCAFLHTATSEPKRGPLIRFLAYAAVQREKASAASNHQLAIVITDVFHAMLDHLQEQHDFKVKPYLWQIKAVDEDALKKKDQCVATLCRYQAQ